MYKRMAEYMAANAQDVLTDGTDATDKGVKRAADENQKYAFLMESSQIEYETERHCSLTQVGKTIDNKGYGIAMKKGKLSTGSPQPTYRLRQNGPLQNFHSYLLWKLGSWYLGLFSQTILKMQEDGRLSGLKRKWWKEKYAVSCPVSISISTIPNPIYCWNFYILFM